MYRRNNTVYLTVILILTILFCAITVYASSDTSDTPRVSARSAALYQPDSKSLLYRKNHSVRMPMASTTKIMTAVLALESDTDMDKPITVRDESVGIEGSSAYLRHGDKVTMRELIYALMLQSANDAATEIAYRIGGDVPCFAKMMNDKAIELGLSGTHFSNPHGLDDSDHYTTAEDLARLAAYALDIEEFRNVCSTYKKTVTTGERVRTYVNHNKLLSRYSDAVGVKTGYTVKCGRCLVGAAERDGLRLISVTLDAPDDWNDHEAMLDYGFSVMEMLPLAYTYEYSYDIPVINNGTVRVTNTDELCLPIMRGDHKITKNVMLDRLVTAPIKEGDALGKVEFRVDGEYVGEVGLIATESVSAKEKTSFFKKIIKLPGR